MLVVISLWNAVVSFETLEEGESLTWARGWSHAQVASLNVADRRDGIHASCVSLTVI